MDLITIISTYWSVVVVLRQVDMDRILVDVDVVQETGPLEFVVLHAIWNRKVVPFRSQVVEVALDAILAWAIFVFHMIL